MNDLIKKIYDSEFEKCNGRKPISSSEMYEWIFRLDDKTLGNLLRAIHAQRILNAFIKDMGREITSAEELENWVEVHPEKMDELRKQYFEFGY